MKKILIGLVFCILLSSSVLAQGPGSGQDSGTQGAGQGTLTNVTGSGQGNGTQETGQGALTNTETQQQNQGEENQIQNQIQAENRVRAGTYTSESGERMQIQEQANNRIQLNSGGVSAQTSMEMTQEQTQTGTRLRVKLSNGQNSEVKIMPDVASENALEQLRIRVCSEENGCQIELKEVGQGEQVKAVYEVQAQKKAKILWLFETKMQVQAQVDAENGEVIQVQKPWWAFLASESEE